MFSVQCLGADLSMPFLQCEQLFRALSECQGGKVLVDKYKSSSGQIDRTNSWPWVRDRDHSISSPFQSEILTFHPFKGPFVKEYVEETQLL